MRARHAPPTPSGSRYAMPAQPQLARPERKQTLRPRRSASGPEKRRLPSATKEKMPITRPTVWSEPPRSCRTCGASAGSTVPIPRNPRKVAAMRHQKRAPKPEGSSPINPLIVAGRKGFKYCARRWERGAEGAEWRGEETSASPTGSKPNRRRSAAHPNNSEISGIDDSEEVPEKSGLQLRAIEALSDCANLVRDAQLKRRKITKPPAVPSGGFVPTWSRDPSLTYILLRVSRGGRHFYWNEVDCNEQSQ